MMKQGVVDSNERILIVPDETARISNMNDKNDAKNNPSSADVDGQTISGDVVSCNKTTSSRNSKKSSHEGSGRTTNSNCAAIAQKRTIFIEGDSLLYNDNITKEEKNHIDAGNKQYSEEDNTILNTRGYIRAGDYCLYNSCTQKSSCNYSWGSSLGRGIHAWVIVSAHIVGARATKRASGQQEQRQQSQQQHRVWILLISTVLLLSQIFVAFCLTVESGHPRCTSNNECNLGNWCTSIFFLDAAASRDPKLRACMDCYYASKEANQTVAEWFPNYQEWIADPLTAETLVEGRAWCRKTDTMPKRCDYIVKNSERLSGSALFTLVFCTFLLAQFMVDDIDQAIMEQKWLSHYCDDCSENHNGDLRKSMKNNRSGSSSIEKNSVDYNPVKTAGGQNCGKVNYYSDWKEPKSTNVSISAIVNWVNFRLRVFVLPNSMVCAATSLLLSDHMTSQKILLNGVAIGFIFSVDDICSSLFLHPKIIDQFLIDVESVNYYNSTNKKNSNAPTRESLRNTTNQGSNSNIINEHSGVSKVLLNSNRNIYIDVFSWWACRVYIAFVGSVFLIEVLMTERLIPIFGNEPWAGAPCSDVMEVIWLTSFSAMCVSMFLFVLFQNFYGHSCKKKTKNMGTPSSSFLEASQEGVAAAAKNRNNYTSSSSKPDQNKVLFKKPLFEGSAGCGSNKLVAQEKYIDNSSGDSIGEELEVAVPRDGEKLNCTSSIAFVIKNFIRNLIGDLLANSLFICAFGLVIPFAIVFALQLIYVGD